LVENGADAKAKNKDGSTPLHEVSYSWRASVDLARILVENGADTTSQDKHGSTPLQRASLTGNLDLVRFFVDNGADATAESEGGWMTSEVSPYGSVDMARLLVEHGADLNAQDKDGSTPLHLASFNCREELARFFVEYSVENTNDAAIKCTATGRCTHTSTTPASAELNEFVKWLPLSTAVEKKILLGIFFIFLFYFFGVNLIY
jgi:ankyrin repeat protein